MPNYDYLLITNYVCVVCVCVFVGVIFAKSPRSASIEQAKAIVEVTRKYGERSSSINMQPEIDRLTADRLSIKLWYQRCQEYLQKMTLRRPLVVGVFQGQSVDEINKIVALTGIDIVQLHGDESVADLERVQAPCIKVGFEILYFTVCLACCGVLYCTVLYSIPFYPILSYPVLSHLSYLISFDSVYLLPFFVKVLHMSPTISPENTQGIIDTLKTEIELFSGKAMAILLDSRVPGTAGGGTGAVFDWSIAGKLNIPVMLAGDALSFFFSFFFPNAFYLFYLPSFFFSLYLCNNDK